MLNTPRRRKAAEPADTQEQIRRDFAGASKKRADRRARKADIDDLKRVPESKDFRHDNPDADIHDWDRYQRRKHGESE